MCFHSREEMEYYAKRWRNDPANHKGFVIMRDSETSAFEEAYHCDVTDKQAVSNTIRNLRAWHPGGHAVDLSAVNSLRQQLGLKAVLEAGLPAPTGEAPESEDENVSMKAAPTTMTYSNYSTTYSVQLVRSDFAQIEQRIVGVRAHVDMIIMDEIIEYIEPTKTGRIRSGMSTENWWKREQRRQENDMKAWFERRAKALETIMAYTPLPPIIIDDGLLWKPKEKRIFAKSDNWIERFMREHKYREDELKAALAA